MFGRMLKVAVVIGLTQLASGCCCCWRPFFCHSWCGGCASAPCSSCYGPTAAPATAAPVIAPLPTVSVAPTPGAPIIPQATSSANNPTIDKSTPFSSANYTHPIR